MVRIQKKSQGVLYEGYDEDYYLCEFREDDVNNKDEAYFFRCDVKKGCCGRVCCGTTIWVLPWWGYLLIALLILLLLLLLLLLLYLCYRLCCGFKRTKKRKMEEYKEVIVDKTEPEPIPIRRPPTPPPKPKPKPEVLPISTQTDPKPTPKPLPTLESLKFEAPVQTDAPPPLQSDPMEYMDMAPPEPIRVDYHSDAEISAQVAPLLTNADPPEGQRARVMYYRPGLDEVASY